MGLTNYIKEELTGWKRWELFWLITACGIILAYVSLSGDYLSRFEEVKETIVERYRLCN